MTYKLGLFVDITQKPHPQLIQAWQSEKIHIADRTAVLPAQHRRSHQTPERWALTRCNRPIGDYDFAYNLVRLGTVEDPPWYSYTLCQRCGTPNDFRAVKQLHMDRLEERRVERQQRAEERQARVGAHHQLVAERLKALSGVLAPLGPAVAVQVFNNTLVLRHGFTEDGEPIMFRLHHLDASARDELRWLFAEL